MKKKRRAHGDGGLHSIRGGTLWRGTLDLGTDPITGKRVRKYVHAKSQREARRKLRELELELEQHGAPIDKTTTVDQWGEKYLEYCFRRQDPNSYTTSRVAVNKWIAPTLGARHIKTLTHADVIMIENKMLDALAASSVKRYMGVFQRMMAEAKAAKLIGHDVFETYKAPVIEEKASGKRGAFTTEQGAAILLEASKLPYSMGSRWWFKLLGGPRQGEILGATLEYLDLDGTGYEVNWKLEEVPYMHGCTERDQGPYPCGFKQAGKCPTRAPRLNNKQDHVHLHGRWHLTPPKSNRGRHIPIVPQLQAAIARYLEETKDWPNPHGLIWRNPDGSPIEPKQDSAEWRDLLQAAGIITAAENKPSGTTLTGHWARHTTVTILAEMGVDFQLIGEIVGHSSREVTKIYRHAKSEEKMAAMKLVSDAFADGLQISA